MEFEFNKKVNKRQVKQMMEEISGKIITKPITKDITNGIETIKYNGKKVGLIIFQGDMVFAHWLRPEYRGKRIFKELIKELSPFKVILPNIKTVKILHHYSYLEELETPLGSFYYPANDKVSIHSAYKFTDIVFIGRNNIYQFNISLRNGFIYNYNGYHSESISKSFSDLTNKEISNYFFKYVYYIWENKLPHNKYYNSKFKENVKQHHALNGIYI